MCQYHPRERMGSRVNRAGSLFHLLTQMVLTVYPNGRASNIAVRLKSIPEYAGEMSQRHGEGSLILLHEKERARLEAVPSSLIDVLAALAEPAAED